MRSRRWRNRACGIARLRQPLVLLDVLVVCRCHEIGNAPLRAVGRHGRPCTSGLLIAWQVIRTRYGDDVDPQAISGLASAMPQYAVLFSLLALAAMGLPPFGVFAGFMGLLLTAPFPSSGGLFITLLAWLAASWYIMQMVQRLLFGLRRPDLRYTEVLRTEFASLSIVVLVLLALGPGAGQPVRC